MAGLKECPNGHLFNATKYGDKCPRCGVECKAATEEQNISQEELEARYRLTENDYVCAWLICIDGLNKGRSYPLKPGKNFIGSGNGMDMQILGDPQIDTYRHATIVFDTKSNTAMALPGESVGIYYYQTNAVYKPTPLEPYEKITIGKTVLVYAPFCGESFSWD